MGRAEGSGEAVTIWALPLPLIKMLTWLVVEPPEASLRFSWMVARPLAKDPYEFSGVQLTVCPLVAERVPLVADQV